MSPTLSTNGHIRIDQATFSEFDHGTFIINKQGQDGKQATDIIVYDGPEQSPVVQLKMNGEFKDSTQNISFGKNDTITFTIEPQLHNGLPMYGDYSFDVNVMSGEKNHPIIDSMTISGSILEAFIMPLTYQWTTDTNGNYNFTFAVAQNDGPSDRISGYKITEIGAGIILIDGSGNTLSVNSISPNIKARRDKGFDGRIRFSVVALDTNYFERQSSVSVNQYDPAMALPPTVSYQPGFVEVKGVKSIYETADNGKCTCGTIGFRLDSAMPEDGNIKFYWNIITGSKLIKINDSDSMGTGESQITKTLPISLRFSSVAGKIGAVKMEFFIKYNGYILESTKTTLQINVLPNQDVTLKPLTKRVYMMNKHEWNVNNLTSNAYSLFQAPQVGLFNWSPLSSSTTPDGLNDLVPVATLIPAKNNFGRRLIANITKYDGYEGRAPYDPSDGSIKLMIESLRIKVVNSGPGSLSIRTHSCNIRKIKCNMMMLKAEQTDIDLEIAKWTKDDELEETDIIIDPARNGFYGRVDMSYRLSDTLGNISDDVNVSFYISPYANMRVKSITGDNVLALLKNNPQLIEVVFENSNDENDFDYLGELQNKSVANYIHSMTKGDCDFKGLQVFRFKHDGIDSDQADALLTFKKIIDQNGKEYTKGLGAIIGIGWKKTVTLQYNFDPNDEGIYDLNFKIPANTKSVMGNSAVLQVKPGNDNIQVRVYNNDTEYFNNISANLVTCDGLHVSQFDIKNENATFGMPVFITQTQNSNSLTVDGIASFDEINAKLLRLDNLVLTTPLELDSLTVIGGDTNTSKINATEIIADNDVTANNIIAHNTVLCDSATVSGEIDANNFNVSSGIVNGLLDVDTLQAQTINVGTVIVSEDLNCADIHGKTINGNDLIVDDAEVKGVLTVGELNITQKLTGSLVDIDNVKARNVEIYGLISSNAAEIASDATFGGDVCVEGYLSVGSDLNVVGQLNAEVINVSSELEVSGTSTFADVNIDSVSVNYDSEFKGGLSIIDGHVRINNEEGIFTDVPITIGSGTVDVLLTVNGSMNTFGNINANNGEILLQNGSVAFNVPVTFDQSVDVAVNGNLNVGNNLNFIAQEPTDDSFELVISNQALKIIQNEDEISFMNGSVDVPGDVTAQKNVTGTNFLTNAFDGNPVKFVECVEQSVNVDIRDTYVSLMLVIKNTSSSSDPIEVTYGTDLYVDIFQGDSHVFIRDSYDAFNQKNQYKWGGPYYLQNRS